MDWKTGGFYHEKLLGPMLCIEMGKVLIMKWFNKIWTIFMEQYNDEFHDKIILKFSNI